jgi:hypothetical protein
VVSQVTVVDGSFIACFFSHISPPLGDFTGILLDIQSHSPSWQKNAKNTNGRVSIIGT